MERALVAGVGGLTLALTGWVLVPSPGPDRRQGSSSSLRAGTTATAAVSSNGVSAGADGSARTTPGGSAPGPTQAPSGLATPTTVAPAGPLPPSPCATT